MDSGNNAWVLVSAALVLFMTPGLAFFYAGMVRSKNVLGMLMQNFFAMGLVSVLWAVVGFSLAFGDGGSFIGNFDFVGLNGLSEGGAEIPGMDLSISPLTFVAFQMMFAVITPALFTGAAADRMKFAGYAVFLGLWSLLVYSPLAHWVWSPTGWLYELGSQDFAGGAVIHINAGVAALVLVMVIGKRRGWPAEAMHPHSLPLTLLGTGILWFGWFGFNAGSALAADDIAAQALVNTHLAAAAGMLGWLVAERLKAGKATTLGGASGAVAGLVAITPAAGFVSGLSPIAIGAIAGVLCYLAVHLKFKLGYDDSLDVVGVHLVGGVVGALLLGVFGDATVLGADGLLNGGTELMVDQLVAVGATIAYSATVSLVLALIVNAVIGLRVSPDDEAEGLDLSQHAEAGYNFGDFGTKERIGA